MNFGFKVSGVCESSVMLRVGIWVYPDTGRQRNLSISATVINLDISVVVDFVIFGGPFFG